MNYYKDAIIKIHIIHAKQINDTVSTNFNFLKLIIKKIKNNSIPEIRRIIVKNYNSVNYFSLIIRVSIKKLNIIVVQKIIKIIISDNLYILFKNYSVKILIIMIIIRKTQNFILIRNLNAVINI